MEYEKFWKTALDLVERKISTFLMIVADSEGSSPGRPGFKMLVSENGELFGSIGGGIMEFNFVELARKKIQNKDFSIQLEEVFHDKTIETVSSGMICSGSQVIIMIPLLENYLDIIKKINLTYSELKRGTILISESGFGFSDFEGNKSKVSLSREKDSKWEYNESIGKNTIYIIGGGHVSLALSQVMSFLGFNIVVFDPRKDIDTYKNNSFANQKISVDYDKINNFIQEGANVYIVIMTSGHVADEKVLRSVITKEVRYLGMMGSPKKVHEVFSNLRKDGIPEQLIEKVKAPIGMPIKSESPEEIAISIASEIIKISKT
jgi:xanthine dehydrogenase accessory factor